MSPTPPRSAELLAGVRAGNPDALGAIYRAHGGPLLALALRLTGSRDEAEDVLHDVFVGLPEALRHYDERGQLASWLKRVTARVALQRMRAARRRRETTLDGADSVAASSSPGVDHVSDVMRAVAALPDSLRTVFVLRAVEGYAHAEIADLLGITSGASEVRFHRAVRRLRALLGDRS